MIDMKMITGDEDLLRLVAQSIPRPRPSPNYGITADELAAFSGVSPTTARRTLRELEKNGALKVEKMIWNNTVADVYTLAKPE